MSTATNKEAAAPSRLGVWLHHHGHSVVFSLGRAWRKPWATLLTVMVMALALALPLGLSIALDNLKHFAGSVQQSRDINLFLKTDVDAAAARQVADTLRGRADVAGVMISSDGNGLSCSASMASPSPALSRSSARPSSGVRSSTFSMSPRALS